MVLGPKTSVSVCVYSPASIYILPSAADIKVGKRSGWPVPRLALIIAIRELHKNKNTPHIQTEHPVFWSFTKEF